VGTGFESPWERHPIEAARPNEAAMDREACLRNPPGLFELSKLLGPIPSRIARVGGSQIGSGT